jgi:hypothetical protein
MLKWFKTFLKNCQQVDKELRDAGIHVHYHWGGAYVHQLKPEKTTHINTRDDRLNALQTKDTRTKR